MVVWFRNKGLRRAVLYAGGIISAGYVAANLTRWLATAFIPPTSSAFHWIQSQISLNTQTVSALSRFVPPEPAVSGIDQYTVGCPSHHPRHSLRSHHHRHFPGVCDYRLLIGSVVGRTEYVGRREKQDIHCADGGRLRTIRLFDDLFTVYQFGLVQGTSALVRHAPAFYSGEFAGPYPLAYVSLTTAGKNTVTLSGFMALCYHGDGKGRR